MNQRLCIRRTPRGLGAVAVIVVLVLLAAVAATVVFAPTVTPRSTVLRAHSQTPSSRTIGALSNSKVGECRSWLPVHT